MAIVTVPLIVFLWLLLRSRIASAVFWVTAVFGNLLALLIGAIGQPGAHRPESCGSSAIRMVTNRLSEFGSWPDPAPHCAS